MTPHSELRLLPWSGPDDKPCYLSADDNAGYLSRIADNAEAVQLAWGNELLDHALELLADKEAEPDELRLLAADLAGALRDAVRVATSRGHRLETPAVSVPGTRDVAPPSPMISG
ncbi:MULTISPECIES: hypothetical protein [unclassified Streptomyces]|uniref:hypothetical protein n=1 Tax=unclassified Streptomyces TaxID=2593676 RepID=UPI002035FA85|nr:MULTISPECIES: hypothetical protein [unclassified Streptomyces]